MNNNKMKTSLFIIAILFITMLVVSGGTFAYLQWMTSDTQLTAINVSVTDDINMYIDPAAVTKTGMRPTNNCAGDFAMVGTSTVKITNNTGSTARPRFKLKIKITDKDGNNITNETSPMGQPYKYYIKYAVTEENGDCTDALAEGRFNLTAETSTGSGWYDSPSLTLNTTTGFPDLYTSVSFKANANAVTDHTYKVTVWVDENYTTVNEGNTVVDDKLQNATITVSWSDNSTVEQVNSVADRPLTEPYAVYSADDSSLRFYRSATPIIAGSTYNGLTATEVYTGFEEETYSFEEHCDNFVYDDGSSRTECYNFSTAPWAVYQKTSRITNVVFEDEIVPISTMWWFANLINCASIDAAKLNVSNVTDMSVMFGDAGTDVEIFNITGIENWDVSKVTNMSSMFSYAGKAATTWNIGDLSSWDTSNVTDMRSMFSSAGSSATTFNLIGLDSWDVSNVTDMRSMFSSAGSSATTFNLIGLDSWDVSNVTTMSMMFYNAGKSANYTLNLSSWNVCNVTSYANFNTGVTTKITAPSWDMECPTT